MPRPIEIRPSYRNDIAFLTRLSQAVEKDKAQPASIQREIQTQLSNLIESLNRADKNRRISQSDDE